MKTKLLLMLLMMVALSVSAAADPISIIVPNFGFETPYRSVVGGYGELGATGSWGYFTTDGYAANWRVESADFGQAGAPEPNQVGFCDVYAGSPGPHGIAQVLAETFEPNQVYTLTVEVGNSGWYEWPGYLIQLAVGGTQAGGGGALVTGGEVIAQDDDSLRVGNHKFVTSTITYFPVGHEDLAGQPLQIRLLGKVPDTGLNEPCFDWVRLTREDAGALPVRIPYPSNGQELIPPTDLTLSWLNADSTVDPPTAVNVKVYWGTDPGSLAMIVPASGNKPVEASSVNVGVQSEGTYYWQVYSWTDGGTTGQPDQEGPVWWYDIVDQPPSVEINTPDMNTWLSQEVSLAATVDDDGGSTIDYLWTADSAGGVSFDDDTALDPTVTITGLIGDPNTVTLTFAATDDKATATDTMTIDVYSDACAATRLGGALWPDTDITGDTCKTDLEDLALALVAWLDDTQLTTPIAKP